MTVWENLVQNSKEVAGQAAGDALKSYTDKLQTTQATTPTAAQPVTKPDNSKWIKIGIAVLAACGLGWLIYSAATKKGK